MENPTVRPDQPERPRFDPREPERHDVDAQYGLAVRGKPAHGSTALAE